MSDLLDAFQQQHQEKLDQLQRDEVDEIFLDEVRAMIANLRQAGTVVASPAERAQLRTLMRFWGNVVYDHSYSYPDTMLQPLDPERVPLAEEPAGRPPPPLTWMLVGAAAAIVVAVGLVLIGRLSLPDEGTAAAPTPSPTSVPVPFVRHAAVGARVDEEGALGMEGETFCSGVPEVFAEFALENVEPETTWHWEVQRADEVVTGHAATPWGQEGQRVVRVLTGGPEGVEPGQYELLIYADDRLVGTRSFRVLDAAPRVFDLEVADVPRPSGQASDPLSERVFEPGVRVIYLSYRYEGLCPGLDISYALYREGEPLQESVDTWDGACQGEAQATFQAPGGLPFDPGSYEAAVAVAGEEHVRVGFAIGEQEAETAEDVSPAFGSITVAMGVQPDGTPILTMPEGGFDWNTKVVCALFGHRGMTDELSWSAVWMRGGQEVNREEGVWDVEASGTQGVHWVAYHAEPRQVLPGGNYSVTLYIDSVAQRTVDFNIRYYVPAE